MACKTMGNRVHACFSRSDEIGRNLCRLFTVPYFSGVLEKFERHWFSMNERNMGKVQKRLPQGRGTLSSFRLP